MLDLLARAGVSSPIAVLTGVLDSIRSQFLLGAKMLQLGLLQDQRCPPPECPTRGFEACLNAVSYC